MTTDFLVETSENKKPRIIALGIIFIIVLVATLLMFRNGIPSFDMDFTSLTPLNLLYMSFASGLFFFGLPLEAALLTAVNNGSPIVASALFMIAGFTVGNLVSYVIGWKLSRIALQLVSAKKVYGLRRKVNAHGTVFVFLANAIPFIPAPVLTFGLGIARYNMARLFTFLVLGASLKFFVVAYIGGMWA
jgi:membrane protein YqaA with SNARE-associated domain